MKRIIAFLAAVILAAGLTACGGEKVPLESDESAGRENVGKVDANVFIPDDTYVIYKESSTKTGVELFYEYNSNGHVTKIAHTYPDGRVEDELYEYTYNSDGSYSFHKTGWGSEYTRSFDEKGRITEEVRSPGSKRYVTDTYTYRDDRTVDFLSQASDGLVRTKETYYYDEKGLLAKTEHFRSDGLLLAYTLYSYDEYGNETTHTQYTPYGEKNSNNAVYEWVQEYDGYGRLVRKAQLLPATGGTKHEELYTYDDAARIYKMTVGTGYTVYEYRPLAECIK